MTAADRSVGLLVALAAGFLAWRVFRLGGSTTAWLPWLLAGAVILTVQIRAWRRASGQAARRLVACADGSLWLHIAGRNPSRVAIGAGTRLVGPSVFLDLEVACNLPGKRLRAWLTPLDVPTQAIRRWSIILPRSGRVSRS